MTMKVRVLFVTAVLGATMWFVGCDHYNCSSGATFGASSCTTTSGGLGESGGGSGSISQTAFVYVVDNKHGGISLLGLNVDASGTFAPISSFVSPTLPVAPVASAGAVVVGGSFLYVPFSDGLLYGFSIDSGSGALTAVTNSPYSLPGGTAIAATPNGFLLFVGDPTGISSFTIGTDGSLSNSSHLSTTEPVSMTVDGLGRYLYTVDGASINAFAVNQTTGVLTSLGSFATGSSIAYVTGEASGNFILGVTNETGSNGISDNHIYVFSISSGALAQVNGSPFATVNPPTSLTVSPNGDFVYAFTETITTGATFDPIEGYSIGSTGTLTSLGTVPDFLGEVGHFDQSGDYLFMVGSETNAPLAGVVPLTADPTSGGLSSTLPNTGAAGLTFAVTDVP